MINSLSFGFGFFNLWTEICLRALKMNIFFYSLRVEPYWFGSVIIFIGSYEGHSFLLLSRIDMFQSWPLNISISL